ncbi:family 3 glycoside hydrolase [Thozetella sp. PMI_491]|nr:family 3 glycoside hydrolase [Thozetella sp. PMI_491]
MASKVDIDAVLQSLTLEEKILLLAGGDFWGTASFPEKGVPYVKTTDGPNGTRGQGFDGSTRAACFPAASSVAATFDPEIAERLGLALAEEARSKGASCVLAPTVCIHRHPLGGRNFESYSEDPFLAGTLATRMIQAVQSKGVAATIKHFVANEQETDRLTVDETISERALREIYLRPFEIAVKKAKPLAVMTAYNLVNGVHCDTSEWLLAEVLRGEWGWEGLVMSDWGGTNSVAQSLKAGLDLEMPGPARVRLVPDVLAALKAGEVSEETINVRARSVLDFARRLGAFEGSIPTTERAIDRPEHRALIRDAGARGVVLLKNENQVLPLSKDKVKGKKIALIGYAHDALAHGGGSASVNAHYKITPWDALHAALGDDVQFSYAKGAHKQRLLPPIHMDGRFGKVVGLDGQPGFTRLFYDLDNPTPSSTLHGQETSAYSPLGSQESLFKILELVADFTPTETGAHYLACSGIGATHVYIDDKVVFAQDGNCNDPMGALFQAATEEEWKYEFEAGKTYRLRIRTVPPTNLGMKILEGRSGVRLGFALSSVQDADLQGEAVRVAQDADLAIIFTGHDPQWETEGRDQDSFNLPNKQNELIAAVVGANPNTIVVNSTGVAVAMPWLDQVPALVQAWFAGQECGNAIADALTGAVNPEGHLPVTFPKQVEDAPAHGNFPGTYVDGKLKVKYEEGVFIGYRHFDRLPQDKVNFPFGHGLSYTTFQLGAAQVDKLSDDEYSVSAEVSNTGSLAGGTVVQVYAGNATTSPEDPIKSLVAYRKVRLQPGEKQTIQLPVATRDFAHFDEAGKRWVVKAGTYNFSLGFSAVDIPQVVTAQIEKDVVYGL